MLVQVVGGKITETGRLGAFITKVKKGSLADVVGHLRSGETHCCTLLEPLEQFFTTSLIIIHKEGDPQFIYNNNVLIIFFPS